MVDGTGLENRQVNASQVRILSLPPFSFMEELFDTLTPNGEYTGKTASRDECHYQGLWHKAVAVFIINSKNQVLLQKRSPQKKLWPGMWDISAGGHVLAGELGFQAVIRECQEELGIPLSTQDILFIGSSLSTNRKGDVVNNHLNEYYIVRKDLDTSTLSLQLEEVSEVKWVEQAEITQRILNHYDGITDKMGCWDYLLKYYQWLDRQPDKSPTP